MSSVIPSMRRNRSGVTRKMASEGHVFSTSNLVRHNLPKSRTQAHLFTVFLGLETQLNFVYIRFKLPFLVTFILGWVKYGFFSWWKLVTNLN